MRAPSRIFHLQHKNTHDRQQSRLHTERKALDKRSRELLQKRDPPRRSGIFRLVFYRLRKGAGNTEKSLRRKPADSQGSGAGDPNVRPFRKQHRHQNDGMVQNRGLLDRLFRYARVGEKSVRREWNRDPVQSTRRPHEGKLKYIRLRCKFHRGTNHGELRLPFYFRISSGLITQMDLPFLTA